MRTSRDALAGCPLDRIRPSSHARLAIGRVLKNLAAQSQISIRTPFIDSFSYKTGNASRSEVENQITCHCKLILPATIIVSLPVPGALETQLRTYLHR